MVQLQSYTLKVVVVRATAQPVMEVLLTVFHAKMIRIIPHSWHIWDNASTVALLIRIYRVISVYYVDLDAITAQLIPVSIVMQISIVTKISAIRIVTL